MNTKQTLMERLRDDRPLVALELRPPRTGLSSEDSMDLWIDMYHAVRGLASQDTVVFLTDNAVGEAEEENLYHATANLGGDANLSRVVPFLTCKHSLDYCLMYSARAASQGLEALIVLGGDRSVGPPRCVPHAYVLRKLIRQRVPSLRLGGWANPHANPDKQVDYILDENFEADFFLTQVVSHHQLGLVERFLNNLQRRGVSCPATFGVFLYRSANLATLERLRRFFPVPAREIAEEFSAGLSAEEICARTIRALRTLGVNKTYVSNLGVRTVQERYHRLLEALEG
ncbi:MAG: hypothetical protein HY704_02910 [Gemmatimonadetes bacterium]|nr:hypothetical protein [Gemmatimonadota bacterium]